MSSTQCLTCGRPRAFSWEAECGSCRMQRKQLDLLKQQTKMQKQMYANNTNNSGSLIAAIWGIFRDLAVTIHYLTRFSIEVIKWLYKITKQAYVYISNKINERTQK